MAEFSLTVLPGPPDVPQSVEISYSGADPAKTFELLVNGVVRFSTPVDPSGSDSASFNIPPGPVRNALADIGSCVAEFSEAGYLLPDRSDR